MRRMGPHGEAEGKAQAYPWRNAGSNRQKRVTKWSHKNLLPSSKNTKDEFHDAAGEK
jgi:hypothetical protein